MTMEANLAETLGNTVLSPSSGGLVLPASVGEPAPAAPLPPSEARLAQSNNGRILNFTIDETTSGTVSSTVNGEVTAFTVNFFSGPAKTEYKDLTDVQKQTVGVYLDNFRAGLTQGGSKVSPIYENQDGSLSFVAF